MRHLKIDVKAGDDGNQILETTPDPLFVTQDNIHSEMLQADFETFACISAIRGQIILGKTAREWRE